MKQLIVIAALAIASLLYACSKSGAPIPPPIDNGTGTGNGGNTGGGNGGGGTDGGTKPPTYTRINVYTTGGNGSFDKNSGLAGIELSDPLIGSDFKTAASADTYTTTKLVHGEGGVVDKNLGQWGIRFPNYSGTDTTKQPYLRTIVTDGHKNLTEYRTYIVGINSYLYKYEVNKPADKMTTADFIASFDTKNVQKVLKAEKGSDANYVFPQTIYSNSGNATYDEKNDKLIGTDVGNYNRGGIKTGVGTNVKQELTGYEGCKVENKKGYLDMTTNDKTVIKYYVMDANGKTIAEYDLPFEAGSHFLLQGSTKTAFTDNKTVYDAAYIAKKVGKDTQAILFVAVKN